MSPLALARHTRAIVRGVAGINAFTMAVLSVLAVRTAWLPYLWALVLGLSAGLSLLLAAYPRSRRIWLAAGALGMTGLLSRPVGVLVEWIMGQARLLDAGAQMTLVGSMAMVLLFATAWLRVVGPLVDE